MDKVHFKSRHLPNSKLSRRRVLLFRKRPCISRASHNTAVTVFRLSGVNIDNFHVFVPRNSRISPSWDFPLPVRHSSRSLMFWVFARTLDFMSRSITFSLDIPSKRFTYKITRCQKMNYYMPKSIVHSSVTYKFDIKPI